MRLAIIGAGRVGAALGGGWSAKGHEVVYGVPDPEKSKYAALPRAAVMRSAQAAKGAGAIVLATPWRATEAAIRELGNLEGKIVIDCTNPVAMGPDGMDLVVAHDTSGGELVATWAASASVFKTLNQTGAENMTMASRFDRRPVMLVAGDDAAAKPEVMRLVGDLGFEAVDGGPLRSARHLERLALLWIELAFKHGQGQAFAFALARRG